jgi:precorrin-2 dehydrogenase
MNLFPIMLNLEDKHILVIGGGEVAFRKSEDLLNAGGILTIISPDFHDGILKLKEKFKNKIDLINRKYEDGDLKKYLMVFSATNDSAVNKIIHKEASDRNILINAVDDPPNCSFYIPSFIQRGDLILSLSTSGASPSMAGKLRRELEKIIPDNIEEMLVALRSARELLKTNDSFNHLDFESRGVILKKIVNDDNLITELFKAYTDGKLLEYLKTF